MNVTARTDRRASPTEDTGYWFLRTPRRFIAAKPNCNSTSAQAYICRPQTVHKALLSR